jgi:PAS domain S-box-containing protein
MNNKKEELSFVCSIDYKVIFDSSPNMVIYKDLEGKVVDANKTYLDFVGLTSEEIKGKSTLEILKDEKIEQATLADDMEVIRTGKPKTKQIRKFVNPFNEKSIWGLFSKVPYFDGGKIAGTVSFIVDITDRIEAEENLRKAENKFRELLQSIPLIVSEVDTDGKFLYWNKYAEDTLGYTEEEAVGKLSYLKLQESIEKYEIIREVIAAKGKFDGDANLRRKDGRLVLVHMVLIPAPSYIRGKGGFYGYAEDISERRAKEDEIKELNKFMVGREGKMIELKEKIRELEERLEKLGEKK